jgi:hypothetical protein
MEKEFNEYEFILYGAVRSLFYRCWSMYGAGSENKRPIDKELVSHWAGKLLSQDNLLPISEWMVYYLGVDEKTIELNISVPNETVPRIFIFNINDELEDYEIFNVSWTRGPRRKVTYKKIPKIFNK